MTALPDPLDDLRLPRQPGVVRQFWANHERLADWLIALFWGLPAVVVSLHTSTAAGISRPDRMWVSLPAALLVAGSCWGFFLRRRRPILALAILSVALVPTPFAGVGAAQVLPAFGVYSLAVYRSNAAAWVSAAIIEGASTLYLWIAAPLGAHTTATDPVGWFPVYGVELLIALALGITVGNRRRYLAALIDRAHQLARERDQQAQLAAVAERSRIARDMHDVVSHSLTVMVTLAEGSAAAAETDASRAAAAMRQVADTGREALAGMRQMLGVLGGDGVAQLAPQPTADDVPALIARFRELGLPIALTVEGTVPPDPAVQLAVYRTVQEGLTNALRYSHGPTSVHVRVGAAADPIVVAVDDDGLPGMPTVSVGAGQGLAGLRARVSALGGTLAAAPHENGAGWLLSATIPRAGSAAPDREESE